MFSRRFLVLSIVAFTLAIAVFLIGRASAFAIAQWIASSLGIEQLYLASPEDLSQLRFDFALAFAFPVVVGWVAVLVHRVRSRTDASTLAAASYLLVPAVGLVGAMALRLDAMRDAFGTELRPIVTLSQFAPDLTAGFLIAVVLWAVVFIRATTTAARPPPPGPASAA